MILASPALDFSLTDSYVVAPLFHHVIVGTAMCAMFSFWCGPSSLIERWMDPLPVQPRMEW